MNCDVQYDADWISFVLYSPIKKEVDYFYLLVARVEQCLAGPIFTREFVPNW